jgi:hypothetical protein
MCHNLAGQGGALTQGKYAPTVMGVEPKHIYEAMITGPQAMPVFGEKVITPEEKLDIIKWIKEVEAEPSLGGATLGRVGPVTEGLLAWTLGLGLLIGVAVWLTSKARSGDRRCQSNRYKILVFLPMCTARQIPTRSQQSEQSVRLRFSFSPQQSAPSSSFLRMWESLKTN